MSEEGGRWAGKRWQVDDKNVTSVFLDSCLVFRIQAINECLEIIEARCIERQGGDAFSQAVVNLLKEIMADIEKRKWDRKTLVRKMMETVL